VLLSPLTPAVWLTTGIPHGQKISPHQSPRADKLGEPGTELSLGGRKMRSMLHREPPWLLIYY
jgi:hypothetical protein